MYNRKDHYYKKAKQEGRASRASYKLLQIQARYSIIKKGDRVIDLGCAPGGWLEVLSDLVGPKGLVMGVDLLPLKIKPRENVKYIQGDIGNPDVIQSVVAEPALQNVIPPFPLGVRPHLANAGENILRSGTPTKGSDTIKGGKGGLSTNAPTHQRTNALDVVLSDMAPNTSGVSFKDSYLSYELALAAFDAAKRLLKLGGSFVVKVFQGEEVERFKKELCANFKRVETHIPPATRQSSKELYLIATGFYFASEGQPLL